MILLSSGSNSPHLLAFTCPEYLAYMLLRKSIIVVREFKDGINFLISDRTMKNLGRGNFHFIQE
jgi:hypothetical protein